MKKVTALAQSPVGRALAVALGLGVVAFMVYKSGPAAVWAAITRVPAVFLIVFLLEIGVAGTESWAAVLVYGPERRKVPLREVVRTSLLCYSLIGVLPFGRAAGEAARAAMLSRYVGVPLAAASAARMQALSLLGNAVISVPCFIGVLAFLGTKSWLLAGIGAHFIMAGVLGSGLLLGARKTKLGTRIGKFFRKEEQWGSEVDVRLASNENLITPLVWISMSRLLRTAQRSALLAAIGASFGVLPSLVSESVNLVASALGDAIPLQVGVTEAGYAFASQTLGISSSDGVAMALIVHVAQVVCVGIGFLSPLLAPPVVSEASQ